MCSNLVTAAQVYALFSATGVIFMVRVFVIPLTSVGIDMFSQAMRLKPESFYLCTIRKSFIGTLLIKQPFFILGKADNLEIAKRSAFGAAATFFVTFVISVVYLIGEGRRTSIILRRTQLTSTAAIQMITGSRSYGQQTNRFGEYTTVSFSDDAVDVNDTNDLHYA